MAIPRLPPAAAPIDITITVNERLLPYMTDWYQANKNPGESPAEFIIRGMITSAKAHWMNKFIQAEIEQQQADLQDGDSLDTELA